MAGKITVVTGPMKSSKTLFSILAARDAETARKRVVGFHPDNSSRWGKETINSRITFSFTEEEGRLSYPSIPLTTLENFFSYIPIGTDLVIFDDAQFFSGEIVGIVQELRRVGIDVWVSGLDMDCFLQPFGPMPFLMAVADEVIKKTAICEDCLEPAQTTYRVVDSKDQILVGDKEYIALCYDCWHDRKQEEDPLDFKDDLPKLRLVPGRGDHNETS